MLRRRLGLLLILTLLVGSAPAGATPPWGPWECGVLLAKEKEVIYWEAKTPAARREAREDFFKWVQELRQHRELVDTKFNFSAPWWNIAFARKNAPMPLPGRMDPKELDALLTTKDGALYLQALRSAYKIAEFRMATSLAFKHTGNAIHSAFVRFGKWTYRNTIGQIPKQAAIPFVFMGNKASQAGSGIASVGRWAHDHTLRPLGEEIRAGYQELPRPLREGAEKLLRKLWAPTPPKKFSRDLPQYFKIAPRVSNAERARTITLYAALKLRSALLAGIDFIFPIHLRTFLPEKLIERTLPIFKKLEKNPRYIPDDAERITLRKYGAEAEFENRRAYLLANPTWSKTARYVDNTYRWGIAGIFATAVGIAVMQSAEADAPMTIEEYLDDPKNKLLPNQIQLLNETLPFPHLSIRIGDVVYSYGYTHMSATPVEQYVREHVLEEEQRQADIAKARKKGVTVIDIDQRTQLEKRGSVSNFMDFLKRHRSIQVVTLSLAPEETEKMRAHFENLNGKPYDFSAIEKDINPQYRKLRRHLILQEEKKYKNITLVNDCASMLVRALKLTTTLHIPKIIDPSPSSIIMYFGAIRMAGTDPRVVSVRLILGNEKQRPWSQLLRNAYVNVREARLFYHPASLLITQGQRAYIDKTHGKSEIQYFEEAFLDRQLVYRDEIEEGLKNDRDLAFYFRKKPELTTNAELAESARGYFKEVYERELHFLESNYTELHVILGALYKIEFYGDAEHELLGTRSFDLQKSLDDPEFYAEIQELLESIDERQGEAASNN